MEVSPPPLGGAVQRSDLVCGADDTAGVGQGEESENGLAGW